MVLESVEDKLTDPCSKNILTKLRANETITEEDRAAADAAATRSAAVWAEAAALAAALAAVWEEESWVESESEAEARAAAVSSQAKWVRENFKLCDLRIK